jgi:hypothetical protein
MECEAPTPHLCYKQTKMAFRRRIAKRRVVGRRRILRRTRTFAKRRPAVRRVVRREIRRAAETKQRTTLVLQDNLVSTGSGASTWNANNVIPLGFVPGAINIQQGTGDGARVGNRIEMTKFVMRAVFVPLPYNATTNPLPQPMQVRLVLFYQRTAPTNIPAPYTDFLAFNNTSATLQNDLTDQIADFNTDKYRILAQKRFKIGFQVYTATSTQTTSTQQAFPNNDFKYNQNVTWDLTKYLPKTVIYEDDDATAQTRSIYMAVIISNADGQVGGGAATPVGIQYILSAKYKDM